MLNKSLGTFRFEVGKKYTLYKLNFMAITSKSEIQVMRFVDENTVVFKYKGKRKALILKLWDQDYLSAPIKPYDGAIFEGWDQPIKCDSEGNSFRGNACYNFVGTPEAVKAWIEAGQKNPYFPKERVLAVGEVAGKEDERAVYPELYEGGCAPMDRVINKEEKRRAVALA